MRKKSAPPADGTHARSKPDGNETPKARRAARLASTTSPTRAPATAAAKAAVAVAAQPRRRGAPPQPASDDRRSGRASRTRDYSRDYSTVTLFARFLGLSTLHPRATAA